MSAFLACRACAVRYAVEPVDVVGTHDLLSVPTV